MRYIFSSHSTTYSVSLKTPGRKVFFVSKYALLRTNALKCELIALPEYEWLNRLEILHDHVRKVSRSIRYVGTPAIFKR